jgi:arginine:ornithine antiporter/lysine permease
MKDNNTLSFTKLTAMIIGSTIGGGIFTTAGDMAASGAHTGSVLIGWAICGIGMFGLMMCFFGLSRTRPDLINGVYSYAREGFGELVGFGSAWGYWVSALLCNVSYTTLLFGAIGYFFPAFGSGNNLLSVVCASVLIWLLNWLVLRGVKEAAALNIITTISKIIPILVFLVAVLFVGAFDWDIFTENFWGTDPTSGNHVLGLPLSSQIKATTAATVWSFIGVEGAVVLSDRARRPSDVGRASLTGFIGILAIYVLVAVLSMGVLTTEELAALDNPQMAGILETAVGPWGAVLVNIGVILSLAGALLGWTILAADCPYSAAKQGVFTKAFTRANSHGSPTFSLYLTNGLIQLFLIVSLFSDSTYRVFYYMSATMIMVPYFLSALYYLKLLIQSRSSKCRSTTPASTDALQPSAPSHAQAHSPAADAPYEPSLTSEPSAYEPSPSSAPAPDADAHSTASTPNLAARPPISAWIFAIVGSLYGLWMLYSSGLDQLLISSILYAPGLLVFAWGKRERCEAVFARKGETIIAILLVLLAALSLYFIAIGRLNPLG